MSTAVRMKRAAQALLMIWLLASPGSASAQANPFSTHAKWMYAGLKFMLLRSADKMPEHNYRFKPTHVVRSFGQIIGHAADAQYRFCSIALGETNPAPAIEKTRTSKADLIAALKGAFAYCDRAYNTMDDVLGAQLVTFDGSPMSKLGVLDVNNLHSSEHYGNLVTYLRMKHIVPPSSEPGFAVKPPK